MIIHPKIKIYKKSIKTQLIIYLPNNCKFDSITNTCENNQRLQEKHNFLHQFTFKISFFKRFSFLHKYLNIK